MRPQVACTERSRSEVAHALRLLGNEVEHIGLNPWQLRTLSALRRCRTAALGGHIDACDSCGTLRISYNSCRNRHCPKCQGHNREAWMQARQHELLPVPYFHVVFTLPEALNRLAMHQPKQVYGLLFEAAWQTLTAFGKQKGVQMGMVAILHTWGQNLSLHPHLHCVVPGGGINKQGKWQNISRNGRAGHSNGRAGRSDGKFLFAVKAMSKMYRAKYVAGLRKAGLGNPPLFDALFAKPWVVYAKRPFGGPKQVIEYLGRYTHKVAISNHRLQQVNAQGVTFGYKDYRTGGQNLTMHLPLAEFIRRFAMHILPKGFVRIRHYGFLSSSWKRQKLPALQEAMHVVKAAKTEEKATQLHRCPCCKSGLLRTILVFDTRGPPQWALGLDSDLGNHAVTAAP